MLSAVVISQLSSGPAWPAAEFCYTQSHRAPTPGGRRQVITQALCSLTHTHAKGSFPVKLLIDSAFDLMKSYNPLSSCLDVDIFRSEWHYCKLQSSPPPFHCLLCKEDEAQRTSLPLCVFVVIFPNFLHNNVPQAILCAVMHWKRANLNTNTKIRDLRWGRAAGGAVGGSGSQRAAWWSVEKNNSHCDVGCFLCEVLCADEKESRDPGMKNCQP